jgi:major intracellular serine protease
MLYPELSLAKEKQRLRIVVIDTGFSWNIGSNVVLCNDGHKDFTGTGLSDNHWHGTHIANIIADRLKGKNFCIIIVKWYDPNDKPGTHFETSLKAFKYISTLKNIALVNYSAEGKSFSDEEEDAIRRLVTKGVGVFVAAGNGRKNLSLDCDIYPACYDIKGLRVVGNKDIYGRIVSNYGTKVNVYENGINVLAFAGKAGKMYGSGSSQATAIATAKAANRRLKR